MKKFERNKLISGGASELEGRWITKNGAHIFIKNKRLFEDKNEAPKMEQGGLFDGAGSEKERKPFINIYLFGNKGLEKQGVNQLKKTCKNLRNQIENHKNKISNPYFFYPNWNTFDDYRKTTEINHWKKEVKAFSKTLEKAEELLRKKGG